MNHQVERKIAQALVIRFPKQGPIYIQDPLHHPKVHQVMYFVNSSAPPVDRVLFEERRRERELQTGRDND